MCTIYLFRGNLKPAPSMCFDESPLHLCMPFLNPSPCNLRRIIWADHGGTAPITPALKSLWGLQAHDTSKAPNDDINPMYVWAVYRESIPIMYTGDVLMRSFFNLELCRNASERRSRTVLRINYRFLQILCVYVLRNCVFFSVCLLFSDEWWWRLGRWICTGFTLPKY